MDFNKILWFTHCATVANGYLKSQSLRREKYRLEREKNHIEMKLKLVRGLIVLILHRRKKKAQQRLYWMKPKLNLPDTEHFWEESVSNFSDIQFKRAFRMTRTTFNYICVTLYPFLRKVDTIIQKAIPLQKRIAITLMYLKGYNDFTNIASLFDVEESILSSLVYEFCKSLIDCFWNKVITFPHNEEEKSKLSERFEQKWRLPGCFGTLGYTNIPIETSSVDLNSRHLFLVAVVDDSYKFMCVDFEQEKLKNDDFFKKTILYNEMIKTQSNKYIISDSCFPLLQWLLTPYRTTSDMPFYQKKYNHMINNARKCIDEAFCRLKSRWQILLKPKLHHAEVITKGCIILHNICEDLHEDFPRSWIKEENLTQNSIKLENNPDVQYCTEGKMRRDALAKILLRNGK